MADTTPRRGRRRLAGLGCLVLAGAAWDPATDLPVDGVLGAVLVLLALVALLGGVTAAAWLLIGITPDELEIQLDTNGYDR